MEFKNATMADFDVAFDYIEKLWTYNTYDKEVIRKVYADVLADENSFAFFLMDGDEYHGFCHGAYFNTFWLSGMTCYVSSIITNEDERGKGNGVKLMDHAKELAKERGCKALVLDSGMPRTQAARAVDATLAAIAEALKNDEKVQLIGFGAFETKVRPARKGRNPHTGETLDIPAGRSVGFKPGSLLRAAPEE